METNELISGSSNGINQPIDKSALTILNVNDTYRLKSSYKGSKIVMAMSIALLVCFIMLTISFVGLLVVVASINSSDTATTASVGVAVSWKIFLIFSSICCSILGIIKLVYGIIVGSKLLGIIDYPTKNKYETLAILLIIFSILLNIGALIVSVMIRNKIARENSDALQN